MTVTIQNQPRTGSDCDRTRSYLAREGLPHVRAEAVAHAARIRAQEHVVRAGRLHTGRRRVAAGDDEREQIGQAPRLRVERLPAPGGQAVVGAAPRVGRRPRPGGLDDQSRVHQLGEMPVERPGLQRDAARRTARRTACMMA